MANGGNVTIKVILDAAQFNSGVNQVKSSLNDVKASGIKDVDESMKSAAQSSEKLGTSAEKAGEKVKGAGDKAKGAGEPLKDAPEKASISWEEFSGKISKAGDFVAGVGTTLTATLTPAIVGVGAASVAAAVTMDSALTDVRKTVDGTEEDYQKLKQAAIEFSKTNAVSADQILQIEALGAQLGFSLDELQEFGEVVSGLDIATNMNAEQAATEMAHFANITKMGHDEISNYGSAIVDLGNHFATTESDISAMAMRVAAAGTTCGMSQADILGLATALSSMGIEAEAGGTAISTIMSQIDKDVAFAMENVAEAARNAECDVSEVFDLWGEDANLLLEDLQVWADAAGMTAVDFAKAWQEDPVNALADLLAGLESATYEGSNMSVMLEELGIKSLRQTDVMKRLAGNSELVGEAVKTANQAWEENTALTAEVENRNASLEAKFEMLRNRVTAVLEKIGGPLCDALLAAVDAAEPLFQAIENGAQAFSEMDKEQQRLVISVAALAAALGPVLIVLGNMMSKLPSIVQGFKDLKAGAEAVKTGFSTLGAKIMESESALGKAAQGFKQVSTSMGLVTAAGPLLAGALAGIGIAAVTALVFDLVEVFQDMAREEENLKGATEGLGDAMAASKRSYEEAAEGLDSFLDGAAESVKTFDQVKDGINGCIEAQAKFASESKETWEGIGSDSALLDAYIGKIETLTNKYDENGNKVSLTAKEQRELERAVAGVNEIMGTTYSVIDGSNGVLDVSTKKLRENADAWIANAKAQAAQEQLVEIQKQRLDQDRQQLDLDKQRKQAQEELQTAIEIFGSTTPEALQPYYDKLAKIDEKQNELNQTNEAADEYEQFLIDTITEANKTLDGSVESIAKVIEATAQLQGENSLAAWCENSGLGVETVAQKLSDLGFTTQEVAELTPQQLDAMASAWNGSLEDIVRACEEAGVEIPPPVKEALDKMKQDTDEGMDEVNSSFDEGASDVEQRAEEMGDNLANTTEETWDDVNSATDSGVDEMNDSISSGMDEANGIVEDGAADIEGTLEENADRMGELGDEGGQNFAQGIQDHEGDSRGAGEANANAAADGAQSQNGNAGWWGSDLVSAFANGIRGAINLVTSAASAVANAVASILHFSKPDEGPLSDGMEIHGEHMVQAFARGTKDAIPIARAAANAVASEIKEGFEGVYDGLVQLPDATKVEAEAAKYGKAVSAAAAKAVGLSGVTNFSAPGIYNTAEFMGYRGAPVTGEGKASDALGSIKVEVNIGEFTNNTREDGKVLVQRISRDIANSAQLAMLNRGR